MCRPCCWRSRCQTHSGEMGARLCGPAVCRVGRGRAGGCNWVLWAAEAPTMCLVLWRDLCRTICTVCGHTPGQDCHAGIGRRRSGARTNQVGRAPDCSARINSGSLDQGILPIWQGPRTPGYDHAAWRNTYGDRPAQPACASRPAHHPNAQQHQCWQSPESAFRPRTQPMFAQPRRSPMACSRSVLGMIGKNSSPPTGKISPRRKHA